MLDIHRPFAAGDKIGHRKPRRLFLIGCDDLVRHRERTDILLGNHQQRPHFQRRLELHQKPSFNKAASPSR